MRRLAILLLLLAPAKAETLVRVDLTHDWKYVEGDSPTFASPDFDDSGWATVPGLSAVLTDGLHWWRKRAMVPPAGANQPFYLTIPKGPAAYTVFVNGTPIGTSGDLKDLSRHTLMQPRTFTVPVGMIKEDGLCLVAIRDDNPFFLPPGLQLPDEGEALLTSHSLTPFHAGIEARRKQWVRDTPALVAATLLFAIGALAFAVWFTDRSRVELLFFALLCVAQAAPMIAQSLTVILDWRAFNWYGMAVWTGMFQPAPLHACFVLAVIGVRKRWPFLLALMGHVAMPLVILLASSKQQIRGPFYLVPSVLLIAVLVVLVWDWVRKRLTLSPLEQLLRVALFLMTAEATAIWTARLGAWLTRNGRISINFYLTEGPFRLSYGNLMPLLVAVVLMAILLRRTAVDRAERQRLSRELEAARSVQALLLSDALPDGVDAVYQPASEVGGDFYHAVETDAGALVVVGDASGKGLQAAMRVAAIIGAVRNRRSDSPAAILTELNRVLAGSPGFTTCCCALFTATEVRIANAGHPAPYVNGVELDVAPALPLGISQDAEFEETTIASGGTFTFVSDGVIEAANASGELFGFARTQAMATKPANDIAAAAQAWGQNDDITVVTVRSTSTVRSKTTVRRPA